MSDSKGEIDEEGEVEGGKRLVGPYGDWARMACREVDSPRPVGPCG